jgi:hypothetical protein
VQVGTASGERVSSLSQMDRRGRENCEATTIHARAKTNFIPKFKAITPSPLTKNILLSFFQKQCSIAVVPPW